MDWKKTLKKVWHFIWEDNSIWSWIANVIIAFVLIKFIVYPGLGLILSTGYPIVAVVSSSMHHSAGFEPWWADNANWYEANGIPKNKFLSYTYLDGFNKGDIMILNGRNPKDINMGDILVFKTGRPDPIIHRVVKKTDVSGKYVFQTKGDNNMDSIRDLSLDETNIKENQVIGVAVFRVPYLGYIKIWFVEMIQFITKSIR